MKRKYKNQQGFGLIEALLLIIAVALVTFVGYYVWHTQKQTNNTLNQAATTSQNAASTKSAQKYLTIKEWGVRAPYNGNLHLEYKIVTQNGFTWAKMSSKELDESDPLCKSDPTYGGVIERYSAGQHVEGLGTEVSNQTVEQIIAEPNAVYSHIGNFYYTYTIDPNPCSFNKTSQNLQTQTKDAVSALVPKLEKVN